MIPWSNGWIEGVQFRGSHKTLTWRIKGPVSGESTWDPVPVNRADTKWQSGERSQRKQLSSKKADLLHSQSRQFSDQACENTYWCRATRPRKESLPLSIHVLHWQLLDSAWCPASRHFALPIKIGVNFSVPLILVMRITVILLLELFPPFSALRTIRVRSGKAFQKSANSSKLKIFSAS